MSRLSGAPAPDPQNGSFRKFGVPFKKSFKGFGKFGVPWFEVLIIRIRLLRVLYQGPLFSETPKSHPKDPSKSRGSGL